MRNGRRLVYTEERVRAMFAKMRGDLHERHFRHMCELSDLRRELDQMRAELTTLRELRAATLARHQAYAELASLYRERELQRARAAERDASTPLH